MSDLKNRQLVAIVEDEPSIAALIDKTLQSYSFRTAIFSNAADFLKVVKSISPEICIIDLGLPDLDGIEVMQRTRTQLDCGILILTGRTHLSDRIMGLEMGADDYVMKPFEPRELVARVRSVLRRRSAGLQAEEIASKAEANKIAEFNGWTFLPHNNTLLSPLGEESILSTAEAEMLLVFISNANRILPREKLMGSRDFAAADRSIDVRVSRLRRKFESDQNSQAIIKTIYGSGYLFQATVIWKKDGS